MFEVLLRRVLWVVITDKSFQLSKYRYLALALEDFKGYQCSSGAVSANRGVHGLYIMLYKPPV